MEKFIFNFGYHHWNIYEELRFNWVLVSIWHLEYSSLSPLLLAYRMEKLKSEDYCKGKESGSLSVHPTIVDRYDGQSIYIDKEARYDLGNYLGGGIAGVVYEAFDKKISRNVAVKILNPIGFKLTPHSTLKRMIVAVKGAPLEHTKQKLLPENVWWLAHPNTRQVVAAYQDPQSFELQEIPLNSCVDIWGWDADVISSKQMHHRTWNLHGGQKSMYEDPLFDEHYSCVPSKESKAYNEETEIQIGGVSIKIPEVPSKYLAFLKSRRSIYREIAHMHKLTANMSGSGHNNVLKLYDVLELVQCSKTTIFLVLELASGGELFDRIKTDYGIDENMARSFLKQLLAGVSYCHNMGVCHRDLKPENLLLTDTDEGPILKIADFGLSAHFIAAVSGHDASVSHTMQQLKPKGSLASYDQAEMRRLNSVVGSPHYVAPEVLQSGGYGYDGRKADVWSLGVITYGMLAGCLPFGKDVHHCARYAKFVEWVRSLPVDSAGRLPTQSHYFQSSDLSSDPLHTIAEDCRPWWNQSYNSGVSNLRISDHHERRPEFPSWFFPKHSSPSARSLLAAMLHPDPVKRISCEEAKKHDWFLNACD